MNNAMLFQGQGKYLTYYVHNLIRKNTVLKKMWVDAGDILGWPILELLEVTKDAGVLTTDKAQPLIFLLDFTVWKEYSKMLQCMPRFMAGHSLGEITALTAAGACTFEEGLYLTKRRGELMQEIGCDIQQGMIALLGNNRFEAEKMCERVRKYVGASIWCANFNSSTQQVLAGEQKALRYIAGLPGIKYRFLSVTKAFHTPYMNDASNAFFKETQKIEFKIPETPVISNVTARPYQTSWSIPGLLCQQIKSPVRWEESIMYLLQRGIMTFITVSNEATFRYMDREMGDNLQWGILEEVINGDLIDFETLYPAASTESFSNRELIAALLRCTLSTQWVKNVEVKIVEDAQKLYDMIYRKSNEKDISFEELSVIATMTLKILKMKGIKIEDAKEMIEDIFESYGIGRIIKL